MRPVNQDAESRTTRAKHSRFASQVAVNVQIRNVSEDLAADRSAQAAARRMSLSEYLLVELQTLAAKPTMDATLNRMAARSRPDSGVSAAEIVREIRGE